MYTGKSCITCAMSRRFNRNQYCILWGRIKKDDDICDDYQGIPACPLVKKEWPRLEGAEAEEEREQIPN